MICPAAVIGGVRRFGPQPGSNPPENWNPFPASVDAEAALQQSLQPFACVDPDPAPSMQWAWCPAWSPAGADPAHCAIAA